MSAAPKSIDEYLASVPQPHRGMLEGLRRIIKEVVPEAEETISYQMPTFKLNGRMLVSFAAFKDHCSLFPATDIRAVAPDEMKGFKGGKGTLQFTADNPIPDALLEKIVGLRCDDVAKRPKMRKSA